MQTVMPHKAAEACKCVRFSVQTRNRFDNHLERVFVCARLRRSDYRLRWQNMHLRNGGHREQRRYLLKVGSKTFWPFVASCAVRV